MVEIKETKGIIKILIDVDENREYRRTNIVVGHTVNVDVNGEPVIFRNSAIVVPTISLDTKALKDEIVNKLESTLSLVNSRAENLIKMIDELNRLCSDLDVEFEVKVERSDC